MVFCAMQKKAPRYKHRLDSKAGKTISGSQATQQHVNWTLKWRSADYGDYNSQVSNHGKYGEWDADDHYHSVTDVYRLDVGGV